MLIYIKSGRRDVPPWPAGMLDEIDIHCREQGHEIVRYEGHKKMPPLEADADLAVIWGVGFDVSGVEAVQKAGGKTLFLEYGFYPHTYRLQMDHEGVNYKASWAREPLEFTPGDPLSVRPDGDLLVLLRVADDVNFSGFSPYFADQRQWVTFLGEHTRMPIRLRPRPGETGNLPTGMTEIAEHYGMEWDKWRSIKISLNNAMAVASLCGSAAIVALFHRIPVLCYGLDVYRHPGAVHCLDASPTRTIEVTEQIAAGKSGLDLGAVEAVMKRLTSHQYTVDQILGQVDVALERASC